MDCKYRPAGPLRWMIRRVSRIKKWDLVGAIAAEMRTNETLRLLIEFGNLRNSCFIDIEDEPSEFLRYTQAARKVHLSELTSLLGKKPNVIDMQLFAEIDDLEDMYSRVSRRINSNVILDITCLPKRFFFYLVRKLLDEPKVKNLIVTYALPRSYGKILHKNPGGWLALPGFGVEVSAIETPMLVIAVGHDHLNLMNLILDRTPKPIRLLMPFPSPPPGCALNWEFIRYIREQVDFSSNDIRRVNPLGVSLAFEHLSAQCNSHRGELLLAPFGPKPLSLAMALYALAREKMRLPVSVGYTQPSAYSDLYSQGVLKGHDGNSVIQAYYVKIRSESAYKLDY